MVKLLQKCIINFPSNDDSKAKIRRNMKERALFYQAALQAPWSQYVDTWLRNINP